MEKKSVKRDWAEQDRKHLLHGGVPLDAFAEKGSAMIISEGHGLILKDIRGKEYIDALSRLQLRGAT
jgi:adenosylmethionine-8-amino-7-oxononanoate aminotransferase